MDLSTILGREAICHKLAVYTNAADRGRLDEVLACFAPRGTLESGLATRTGHDAMRAFFERVVAVAHGGQSLAGSRHNLTTCRIEIEDRDRARAWTYLHVIRAGTLIQSGFYIDRLVRDGENWLFEHRRVKLEFDH